LQFIHDQVEVTVVLHASGLVLFEVRETHVVQSQHRSFHLLVLNLIYFLSVVDDLRVILALHSVHLLLLDDGLGRGLLSGSLLGGGCSQLSHHLVDVSLVLDWQLQVFIEVLEPEFFQRLKTCSQVLLILWQLLNSLLVWFLYYRLLHAHGWLTWLAHSCWELRNLIAKINPSRLLGRRLGRLAWLHDLSRLSWVLIWRLDRLRNDGLIKSWNRSLHARHRLLPAGSSHTWWLHFHVRRNGLRW